LRVAQWRGVFGATFGVTLRLFFKPSNHKSIKLVMLALFRKRKVELFEVRKLG
jgi:hypothetical protein